MKTHQRSGGVRQEREQLHESVKERIDHQTALRCNEKYGTSIVIPTDTEDGILKPEDWGYYLDEWEDVASEIISDYEHCINWNTTCKGCADQLDYSMDAYFRIEKLNDRLESVRESVKDVVLELADVDELAHPLLVEIRERLQRAIQQPDAASPGQDPPSIAE